MKRLFSKFFCKSFLIFFVIGVLTTLIHLLIYNLALDALGIVFANTLAFILSSLFSYGTNARFSFNKKMNHTSFWLSMLTFVLKLLASNLLSLLFEKLFIAWKLPELIKLIPIPVTCILFPIQYIVFNHIFIISKNEDFTDDKK